MKIIDFNGMDEHVAAYLAGLAAGCTFTIKVRNLDRGNRAVRISFLAKPQKEYGFDCAVFAGR